MLKVRIVENSRLVPKGYAAITLYPFILFEGKADEATYMHEMVHVEQIRRVGWLMFYLSYLWYYLKNLAKYRNHQVAYLEIPYEKEAYQRVRDKLTA